MQRKVALEAYHEAHRHSDTALKAEAFPQIRGSEDVDALEALINAFSVLDRDVPAP